MDENPLAGHASFQFKPSPESNNLPIRYRLPKQEIIRKTDTFREILADGKRWHEKHITIVYRPSSERRAGFAVSRRLGNASVRNRMKRRMREVYRHRRTEIGSFGMILMAKAGLERVRFQDLQKEFDRFLQGGKVTQ